MGMPWQPMTANLMSVSERTMHAITSHEQSMNDIIQTTTYRGGIQNAA